MQYDADQRGFTGSESDNPEPTPTTAAATARNRNMDTAGSRTERIWVRYDGEAITCNPTNSKRPLWELATRRITIDTDSDEVMEDPMVTTQTRRKVRYRELPSGPLQYPKNALLRK